MCFAQKELGYVSRTTHGTDKAYIHTLVPHWHMAVEVDVDFVEK